MLGDNQVKLQFRETSSDHLVRKSLADARNWKAITTSGDWQTYLDAWLEIQVAQLEHCQMAVVAVGGERAQRYSTIWPSNADDIDFKQPMSDAEDGRRGVVVSVADGLSIIAAYPLVVGDKVQGVVAAKFANVGRDANVDDLRRLQWGIAWLRERIFKQLADNGAYDSTISNTVLELLASGLEERKLIDAARAVVTALADDFNCDRASIGLLKNNKIAIEALSHSAHFSKDMKLFKLLSDAMHEALDEGYVLSYSSSESHNVLLAAHKELSQQEGASNVVTVPIMLADQPIGALCIERGELSPFTQKEAMVFDLLATALAPILEEKRLNERSYWHRFYDDSKSVIGRLVQPDNALPKFIAFGAACCFILFFFWTSEFEVVADSVVEGREQRILSAGFDGFLVSADVRPGDRVEAGQVLATLDDTDLTLERARLVADQQRDQIAFEQAFGERDPVQLRIAQSRLEQVEAQIGLVDHQLSLAEIRAPFDGVVVSGDLSQRIGGSVERSEVLFQMIPADSFRAMLQVDERDIDFLEAGQSGHMRLAALPGVQFDVSVQRITPVSEIVQSNNIFRVEADLAGDNLALLRPGLSGAARVAVGEKRVIWIWTRSFINWLRLTTWRLF